ncbi:MAG: hypothetical protein M3R16_05265 [Pseudomonadota bacterium]|nr:hypothetical protein [Pseudomonadota bacterium]
MRSTLSLIWKEYREQRWFLIAALAIFCGFPLIEATGRYYRPPRMPPEFYSDSAPGLVFGLGALLAIFVAIGSTTRDLRDELHVFWRSRPIGIGAWLGVKYIVGLLTVLIACTVPMLLQFAMLYFSDTRHYRSDEVGGALGVHTFTVVLIFSIAFLLGCLVRHATHAALLAVAAAMVIYFLPVVLAPLSFLSPLNLLNNDAVTLKRGAAPVIDGWSFLLPLPGRWRFIVGAEMPIFAAAMLGGSIVAAIAAWIVVRRDWRVAADRQAMHWSLGGVAMLLFGATAFQVGSNLKVKEQFDLPLAKHTVANLAFDGTRGVALIHDSISGSWDRHVNVKFCTIEMTPNGIRYGPVVEPEDKINVPYALNPVTFWRPEHPDRAYLLAQRSKRVEKAGQNHLEVLSTALLTIDLTAASADPVLHRLDLAPHMVVQGSVRGFHHGDTLYVNGIEYTAVIDLSNPDAPAVKSILGDTRRSTATQPVFVGWFQFVEKTDAAGRVTVDIPLIDFGDLPPRELLKARLALANSNDRYTLAGDLFIRANEQAISTYRLVSLDSTMARFELLGRREFTPLERLMGSYIVEMTVIDDRLYARQRGIAVYDLSDPTNPRAAGHFAMPRTAETKIARLTNGDILLAAKQIYTLAPPNRVE